MKYFELTAAEPGDPREEWTLDFPDVNLPDWPLDPPGPVTDWNERIFAHYKCDAPHKDYPCVLGAWNVCSARFRALLDQLAPGAIQFLPFRIRSIYGDGEVEGYSVINFTSILDCLDRERSIAEDDDWEPQEYGDIMLERTVLSRALIGDHTVFRVLGDSNLLIVREDAKDAITRDGLTGCHFAAMEVA